MALGTILSCLITGQETSIWIVTESRNCVIGTAALAQTGSCYWNSQQTARIFECAISTLMAEKRRCAATARAASRGLQTKSAGQKAKISFETPAGVISAELKGDLVTLRMTEPTDLRLNVDLPIPAENKTVHFINSGVPHVVIPIAKIDDADVRREGAAIRYHNMFSPNGTNVNFIEKRGPNKIAIRTYERGVEDETLACGTGIVASALIFAATENIEGPSPSSRSGGDELQVGFEKTRAITFVTSRSLDQRNSFSKEQSRFDLLSWCNFVRRIVNFVTFHRCFNFARHDIDSKNVSRHVHGIGHAISRWRH